MNALKVVNCNPITRRRFIKGVLNSAVGLSTTPVFFGCASRPSAETETRLVAANGLRPRIVARSGLRPSVNSDYQWHSAPDGAGTFSTSDGGWIYVSNSEKKSGHGSVGALRFDKNGEIMDAYSILKNTSRNCSGSETLWNTWLSCEEVTTGKVWECDPFRTFAPISRPELGIFKHESACVDPNTGQIYLTEDRVDGCLYRYTPDSGLLADASSFSKGLLEVARKVNGFLEWHFVPDPSASVGELRYQVKDSKAYKSGEGYYLLRQPDIFHHKER